MVGKKKQEKGKCYSNKHFHWNIKKKLTILTQESDYVNMFGKIKWSV